MLRGRVGVCVWLAAEGYIERVRQLSGYVSGVVGRVDCVSRHDGLQLGPNLTRSTEPPPQSPSGGGPRRSESKFLVLRGLG